MEPESESESKDWLGESILRNERKEQTHRDGNGHSGECVLHTHCEDGNAYSVDLIAEAHTLTTSSNNDEDVEELRNVGMRRSAETHTLTISPNNDEDMEELRNVGMRRSNLGSKIT